MNDEPRELPNNVECEQALLGAILVNNEAFYRVADFLEPDHFFEPIHRAIFEVCGQLIRADKAATPITVKTYLPNIPITDDTPLPLYLARLYGEATTIINAEDYGRTIYDLAKRRALISLAEDMKEAAFALQVSDSAQSQIDAAEKKLFAISGSERGQSGFRTIKEALAESVDHTAAAYKHGDQVTGLPTGLSDLDRLMGGMQASDLIIVAGRPGMGKSALASNIGLSAATAGRSVGMFSLEMSSEQIATRLVAEQSGISSSDMRRGRIHEGDFARIVDAARQIQDLPFYIDQTGGLSVADLVARARRLHRQKGLDLLIVDYIQLLTGSRSYGSRSQEVSEVSGALKTLAKHLNIPVLALSQLSRQVEQREDKRPQLSDLRESGAIEQDADVVLFIYREEYYLKNAEPKPGTPDYYSWQGQMEKIHGLADLILAKQRNGPTGTVRAHFDHALTKFSNLAQTEMYPRM